MRPEPGRAPPDEDSNEGGSRLKHSAHHGQRNAHRFLLVTGSPLPVRPVDSARRPPTATPSTRWKVRILLQLRASTMLRINSAPLGPRFEGEPQPVGET